MRVVNLVEQEKASKTITPVNNFKIVKLSHILLFFRLIFIQMFTNQKPLRSA